MTYILYFLYFTLTSCLSQYTEIYLQKKKNHLINSYGTEYVYL